MPSALIKPDPEQDWYFKYSTIVEGTTFEGTADQFREHDPKHADELIALADQDGSSNPSLPRDMFIL